MDNRIVDLHVHSTESDGTFTPTEVIAEAKKAGLSAIALTDHDTATGIRKAMGAAKGASASSRSRALSFPLLTRFREKNRKRKSTSSVSTLTRMTRNS